MKKEDYNRIVDEVEKEFIEDEQAETLKSMDEIRSKCPECGKHIQPFGFVLKYDQKPTGEGIWLVGADYHCADCKRDFQDLFWSRLKPEFTKG